jgi:hypothetical protein
MYIMSVDFEKLEAPTEMPASQIQRIANLKCPPPFKPSQANSKVRALNAAIKAQMSEIEMLEKVVTDLEKRYKIMFTCDNAPTFWPLIGSSPVKADVSLSSQNGESVTNMNISIKLIAAANGIDGLAGLQGKQGEPGKSVLPGATGPIGYYGMRGNLTI